MSGVRLEEVCRCDTGQDGGLKTLVFVFPGIGTPTPADWYCAHQKPWLKALVDRLATVGIDCTVLAIDHGLVPDRLRSWDHLLQKGRKALEEIQRYRNEHNALHDPVVLIGHSLGGVIVKQALIHAHRSRKQYEPFFQSLQGLVFLSTPHLPTENSPSWQIPIGILQIQVKRPDSELATELGLQSLARVSELFDYMALPVPVFTTWETRPQKLKGVLQYTGTDRFSKCVLVDKALAQTSAEIEHLEPIDADHFNTCALDERSNRRRKILDFIYACLDEGRVTESTADQIGHIPPASDLSKLRTRNPSSPALSPSSDPSNPWPGVRTSTGNRLDDRRVVSLPDILEAPDRRPDPKLQCHIMEPGIALTNFFSREDVFEEMNTALADAAGVDDAPNAVKLLVLHGVAGIGKSSAAAEYLRRRRRDYDITLWIRAESTGKVMDAFSSIAVSLRLLDPVQTRDRLVTQRIVLDWLEDPVKSFDPIMKAESGRASYLIVFDNVVDGRLLKTILPKTGGGSVIVTSRNPRVLTEWSGPQRTVLNKMLKPFETEEAATFLKSLARNAETPEYPQAAAKLATRLGGLPLSLRQMGDFISRKRLKFQQFLEIYRDSETEHGIIHSTWDHEDSVSYPHTLSTAFHLHRLTPRARALLNVVSLMDPDNILEATLVDGELDIESDYPLSQLSYLEARDELWERSLVTHLEDQKALQVHRTVQDVALSTMDSAQLSAALEVASKVLLHKWPVKGRLWHYPIEHWEACQALAPHVSKMHSHFIRNSDFRKAPPSTATFANLLTYAGWYFHERGDPGTADSYFGTAESLCELPRDESLLADLWLFRGCVATETNDADASIKYYKMRLERTQTLVPHAITPEDHDDLAIAYNEMGVGYMMKGAIEDAWPMLELARHHSDFHRKKSDTATFSYLLACANLGLAHWLTDQWEDALNVLMQAYQFYRKQHRFDDKEAFVPGRLMHALGNVKVSQGLDNGNVTDLDEGFDWHQKAYEHYKKTIGDTHHRTADVSHRLGDDYMIYVEHAGGAKARMYPNAGTCLDRALKVFNSKDCYRPEKMRTTHLKGQLRVKEGDAELSEPLLEEARRIYADLARDRGSKVPERRLKQEDFDNMITFWSR